MISYENGFQCLEIYQKNGKKTFLPRELLVREFRLLVSWLFGIRLAMAPSTSAYFSFEFAAQNEISNSDF